MKTSTADPGAASLAGRRRRRALTFVVLLLVAAVVLGVVTRDALPGVLREAVHADTWEVSPVGVFDELEGVRADEREVDVPEGFEEEVLTLEGLHEVQVDPHSAIVGFASAQLAESAFKDVSDELEVRGWAFVDSGSNTCGTFVKETGKYRWAFVSCVQVGSSTSVVIQSALADERTR